MSYEDEIEETEESENEVYGYRMTEEEAEEGMTALIESTFTPEKLRKRGRLAYKDLVEMYEKAGEWPNCEIRQSEDFAKKLLYQLSRELNV